MKKTVLIITAILLITLCACDKVALDTDSDAFARFIDEENSVVTQLTAEDADALSAIFNEKALYNETPPCGFTTDFAVTIDDKTFCIASDGCPFVYLYESKAYFLLSSEESNKLNELLSKYGVVYDISEESEESK